MARKYIDCREMPSESNCTVAIAADSAEWRHKEVEVAAHDLLQLLDRTSV